MDSQNTEAAADSLAQQVIDALRKSGCEAWLGFPPPEEMERLRTEKAKRDAVGLRKWLEAKDRRLEALKESAKRRLKGEIADE